MRYIDEFRQPAFARALVERIRSWAGPPVNLMEVCGTHTVAVFRHGLRGVCTPPECRLFGKGCTPEHPIGPCMVSTEGTCAAWYIYGAVEPMAAPALVRGGD